MAMRATLRWQVLLVLLVAQAFLGVMARKKKSKSGADGGDDGMTECTTIYLGGYHNGTQEANYIAWDASPLEDNETTTMLSDILKPYCTPIASSDGWAQSTGDDSRRSLAPSADFEEDYSAPVVRRLLSAGRKLLAGSTTLSYYLPFLPDTCDHDEDFSTCESIEYQWECTITNVNSFMQQLRDVNTLEADDCWNTGNYSKQCEGAPTGPQNCSFTALGANEFVSGMTVTINGDRCSACSLNVDNCPKFYDVHTCSHEWTDKRTDAAAETALFNTTFTFTIVANSAPSMAPSLLLAAGFAMMASVLSWT